MDRLAIQLKRLENDMDNKSKNEVENKRIDYLKILLMLIKNWTILPPLATEEAAAKRPKVQGLKTMAPSQLITRLSILLLQLKAGSNSQKLKNEIRQIVYSLYRSKNLSKAIYNHLINSI